MFLRTFHCADGPVEPSFSPQFHISFQFLLLLSGSKCGIFCWICVVSAPVVDSALFCFHFFIRRRKNRMKLTGIALKKRQIEG